MEDWTLSNWVNFGILLATILVGLLTWFGSRRSAREALSEQRKASDAADRSASAAEKVNALQQRIVDLEEQREADASEARKRATLRAEYLHDKQHPGAQRFYLIIENVGQATARDLRIAVDGVAIDDHKQVQTQKPTFELSIGPGGTLRFPLTLHLGGGLHAPFDVQLEWSDDSAEPGAWQGSVS